MIPLTILTSSLVPLMLADLNPRNLVATVPRPPIFTPNLFLSFIILGFMTTRLLLIQI